MASTPPIIFKRNKPKPTGRARETSVEAETPAETAEESPSTVALKLKNRIKHAKPKSQLSFGTEEEEGDGEVFQIKKSKLSRKMKLGTHPSSVPLSLDQATISNTTGPTYDAAYLNELKANTPSARPRPPVNDPYDADMSMAIDDDSIQNIDIEDTTTFIPSESSIKVAKERRERLRKTQISTEEEFISLSVTKRDELPQGPHPESRLVREEDELGEGDDEFAEYTSAQERIALGKKSKKKEAAQRREAMMEQIADAEEVDEETAEWEQEQLRRGGHRTPEPTASRVKEIYRPAAIPPATAVPTLGPAISRLADQLAQLTTSHAQNSASLNTLAQERLEVDNREKEMRELVEKAEIKRAWFGSFKDWVESVASFLDEKYPILEELEARHVSLLKERHQMVTKRRRDDDQDDLSTFIGPLPLDSSTEGTEEQFDEFGRVIPKPSPLEQRRARRAARIARRQTRQLRNAKATDEEGYSTDSSLPQHDQNAYSSALEELAVKKKDVLADVRAEEFRDPGKGRWTTWREKYSDSYVGAWGGLGVVSVWEFWVRLESLDWDCIENHRSLHSFKWYKSLYEYCRPGDGTVAEERELGPDGDLVASMISTAVIPMLCKVIEGGALDVYSTKHVRRMIDLAEEIEASIEVNAAKFQTLLKTVMEAFQAVIAETESTLTVFRHAQRAPGFDPEAIPARKRYLARHIKLLKNILLWRKYTGERFGLGMLVGKLVDDVILGIAQDGWQVGGKEIVQAVAKILPVDLVPPRLKMFNSGR